MERVRVNFFDQATNEVSARVNASMLRSFMRKTSAGRVVIAVARLLQKGSNRIDALCRA